MYFLFLFIYYADIYWDFYANFYLDFRKFLRKDLRNFSCVNSCVAVSPLITLQAQITRTHVLTPQIIFHKLYFVSYIFRKFCNLNSVIAGFIYSGGTSELLLPIVSEPSSVRVLELWLLLSCFTANHLLKLVRCRRKSSSLNRRFTREQRRTKTHKRILSVPRRSSFSFAGRWRCISRSLEFDNDC